ncbi:hypothetical protein SDJN03_21319, partial [Cucurbita argyrosperma subsp. sororia]
MEISGKRKRKESDRIDSDDTEIEKFSEIVDNFRAPYNWFRAKITGSGSLTNGHDLNKNHKIVHRDSNRGVDGVWMPCFLVEDFEEQEVIKSWKARALPKSQTADPAAAAAAAAFEAIDGGEEAKKKDDHKELDLRLSL